MGDNLECTQGFYRDNWEPFERGRNYQAFALKAR